MNKLKKKESIIPTLSVTISFGVIMGLKYLMELRSFIWLSMILTAAAVITKIFLCFNDKEQKHTMVSQIVTMCGTIIFLVLMLPAMSGYSFSNGGIPWFWKISLILGIIVGFLVAYKFSWKNCKTLKQKIILLLVVIGIAIVVIYIYLAHFNYILDTNEPRQCVAVIEDKEHRRHRKSADSYEFQLTVDGETFYLDVSSLEYERYEVGDTYLFAQYQGAFNEPFFIAEN